MDDRNVCILTCNQTSLSYALLYASGGHKVVIYAPDDATSREWACHVSTALARLEGEGRLKGSLTKEEQEERISFSTDVGQAVKGAVLVQECLPDDLSEKQTLWQAIDKLVGDDVILVSSMTLMAPSKMAENMTHRGQFLVVNHVEPLYHLTAMEVVPSQWTPCKMVDQVTSILKGLGQAPVVVKKEVPGFLIQRIQAAVMREAYHLVHDGIVTADECDILMTKGIGLRYAIMGIWQTQFLDCDGMYELVKNYGDMVYNTQLSLKPVAKMEKSTLEEIRACMERVVGPRECIPARTEIQMANVGKLVNLKDALDQE